MRGMKNESRHFGLLGPGITPRGIRFSTRVRISGGKLKLTNIIGQAELLFFFPSAGLTAKTCMDNEYVMLLYAAPDLPETHLLKLPVQYHDDQKKTYVVVFHHPAGYPNEAFLGNSSHQKCQ